MLTKNFLANPETCFIAFCSYCAILLRKEGPRMLSLECGVPFSDVVNSYLSAEMIAYVVNLCSSTDSYTPRVTLWRQLKLYQWTWKRWFYEDLQSESSASLLLWDDKSIIFCDFSALLSLFICGNLALSRSLFWEPSMVLLVPLKEHVESWSFLDFVLV